MKASTKNSIVAALVGFPLCLIWPVNDSHFWLVAMPAWTVYSILTKLLPVYTEHIRRPPFSKTGDKPPNSP